MTISTDALIDFFGTEDTVTSTGASVTDGSFASAGSWTNDDDAPEVDFQLIWQYASGTLTVPYINLRARRLNVSGTDDEPGVDSGYNGVFLGTFPVDANAAAATDQFARLRAALPNFKPSSEWEFYIENQTNVTISANWTLKARPVSPGPHP